MRVQNKKCLTKGWLTPMTLSHKEQPRKTLVLKPKQNG